MKKYFSIFKISLKHELAYKLNFVMWRVRNIFQIIIIYFLWNSVFTNSSTVVFGYDREAMLTYVFGVILIRSLVFSARSGDIPGEIGEGRLSNYLIRPVNYFKFWITRDLANKILNFGFSLIEFTILSVLLKPNLFLQTNILNYLLFILFLIIANYLIFVIRFIVSSITFWLPELAWGGQFLIMVVITEFLSGSVFPLDILPNKLLTVFSVITPFPYLVFFPLQVYLGKVPLVLALQGLIIAAIWTYIVTLLAKKLWNKGLLIYNAEGR